MRIFDRIASGESVYVWDGSGRVTADVTVSTRKIVHQAVRVVADEAAQYGMRHPDRHALLSQNDFGPIMPTFPSMWIEWREPLLTPEEAKRFAEIGGYAPDDVAVVVEGEKRGDAYELRLGPSILYRRGYPLCALMTGIKISVDNYGRCLGATRLPKPDAQFAHESGDYWSPMLPAFQTLGWMNCKNLAVVKRSTAEKLRRARMRRGQFPGLDYHVVEISGSDGVGSLAIGTGLGSRLHMVRGHFAVYTPDAPLFGKYVGAYWKPSHVRGNAELGCVSKEYHVTDREAQ